MPSRFYTLPQKCPSPSVLLEQEVPMPPSLLSATLGQRLGWLRDSPGAFHSLCKNLLCWQLLGSAEKKHGIYASANTLKSLFIHLIKPYVVTSASKPQTDPHFAPCAPVNFFIFCERKWQGAQGKSNDINRRLKNNPGEGVRMQKL